MDQDYLSPMRANERPQRWQQALALAAVFLAAVLPRVLALERFVTTDEPLWVTRSANFYCALARREYANTFQREHPGVVAMWAGAASFLSHLPDYGSDCQYLVGVEEHEQALRERGLEPIRLLATGRFYVVLLNTMALMLAFVFAWLLFGLVPALIGFALIAFDPFHVAHSRLLHLDGLLSSFVLLALLAFISYLRERRLVPLLLSGVAAGLSWLTKSSGILLIPFVGLVTLIGLCRDVRVFRNTPWSKATWQHAWPLVAWFAVGAATFVVLWPAMWVDPIGTLTRVLGLAGEYAAGGHGSPVFFDGQVVADGKLGAAFWYFYPLTWLWRSTPVVLLGLVAALTAYATKRAPFVQPRTRQAAVSLLLFALIFGVAISVSAKKFDRYLLPAYAPLDLLAAMGWTAVLFWLMQGRPTRARAVLATLALCVVGFAQIVPTLRTFPYYLSYYNPAMGGSRRAPEVMGIGWGEGLERAAHYLAQKPGGDQPHVFSWYRDGSFSYFYPGASELIPNEQKWTDMHLPRVLNSDYAVIYYVHQQQRQAPRQLLNALGRLKSEHTIWLNGLEYVRIYRLSAGLQADPAYVNTDATLGQQIRFEGYKLPNSRFAPGDIVPIWLSWRAMDAPGERLKVFLHILDGNGALVAQTDAEPVAWSRPTDSWQPGEQIADGYGVHLPLDLPPGEYTLVVGMYRSSGERLPVVRAGTSAGDTFPLGQLSVYPD